MKSKILQQNARSVVLELLLEDRYETRPYELWVNGEFLRMIERWLPSSII